MPNTISTSTNSSATLPSNNTLVTIASDGTANVLWFDGTNAKLAYAASPYTSWTVATLTSGARFAAAGYLESNSNIAALSTVVSVGIDYLPLTKSGSTYSVGSTTLVTATPATGTIGGVQMIAKDSQGRYWSISNSNNATLCQVFWSSTPTVANWTSSLSATASSNAHLPAGDIVNGFLVAIYPTAATTFVYQRIDTTVVSLGAWSGATTIASLTGSPDNTRRWCFRSNGSDTGMLVYSTSTGIYAKPYTASTDTWGTAVQLSTGASDVSPTLCQVSGDLYAFWCKNNGTNDFSLVYKKYTSSSSTWDTSATTLVAGGTNITNPSAGFNSGTIGVVYTVGTATPWNVNFATISLGAQVTASVPLRLRLAGLSTRTVPLRFPYALPSKKALPMPIISRGLPVSASASNGTQTFGNDADYTHDWRSTGALPAYLAYDMSGLPSIRRKNVVAVYYNKSTGDYDHAIGGSTASNNLGSYTVDVNTAAGGSLPGSGWVTLATVSGNTLHSRQHLLGDLSTYNWIRINVTVSDGSTGNTDAECKFELFDANMNGISDNWIIYGDSITSEIFNTTSTNNGPIVATLINTANTAFSPIMESGAIGGVASVTGVNNINTWLGLTKAKYIGLDYGGNDANTGVSATTYYSNMQTMVLAVLAANKIPVIPKIAWAANGTNKQANAPALNAKVDLLYSTYSQIVPGPDFWTYMLSNQSLISVDGIHFTVVGYTAARQLWASTLLAAVYNTPNPVVSGRHRAFGRMP